ncbi:lysophospholipid acyltransferase family protein [Deinococcus sp. KNUC1210]|uniref:lysophospholipid acyltransferase family protein n=1 Tax=Deinococcus sp. KNUC1210 TaxID=2917691 RepID=UPI001EF12832|nr:lysophospholipid acyltransferase family protein [Deinococcus sp. KNUC1210]ULH16889.1 lysophospholipid acyltransferase family protein [Deinococcus sp. KNUC1210]
MDAIPPDLVTRGLDLMVHRSVVRGLRGIWVRGHLPEDGAILAPSHQSWWDGYVLFELCRTLGQPFRVLMTARQFSSFPFLRRLGALPDHELRAALRAAQAGAWVVVFPEGELRPAGPLTALQPGAGWLARRAGVPLVPVALRVTMRGQQQPEAYLRVGLPTDAAGLQRGLQHELSALDAELQRSDPEEPLAGYLRLTGGGGSQNERLAGLSRLLARVTGDR